MEVGIIPTRQTRFRWLLVVSIWLLLVAPARAQELSEDYIYGRLVPAAQEMEARGLTENNLYELIEIIERYGLLDGTYQSGMEISSWETWWLVNAYSQWQIDRTPYEQNPETCAVTAAKADAARRLSRTLYTVGWLNWTAAGLLGATGVGAPFTPPLLFAGGVLNMSGVVAGWIAQDYANAPCIAG